MAKLHLIIANKNYSSWSLRPWLAMAMAGLDFDELVGAKPQRTRRQRSDVGVPLQPKYRGPNGETYKGRGPVPKWLSALERKGVDREKFRIKGT